MSKWKRKVVTSFGEYLGRDIMKKASEFTEELENWTSKNPMNARNANPVDEDEYMRRREELYNKRKKIPPQPPKPDISKLMPMQRDVSTWSSEDLNNIMNSREYQFDKFTQNKVKKYFDHKYPGPQKLDATGRPD